MIKLVSSTALAMLLGLGVAFSAHAGEANKAADRSAQGASAGASSQGELGSMSADQLIGKKVVSAKGNQLGEISDILRSQNGASYALVDLPGDATPPAKELMPLDELQMEGGQVTWTSERAEDQQRSDRSARGQGAAAGSSSDAKQGASAGKGSQASHGRLHSSLQKAGLQDVQVVDSAYLVRAKAADGSPVFMMIDPPSAGAAAGSSQQSGQASADRQQASAMGQDGLRTSLQNAGFQDVAVLDAAYLITAKSQDGTPMRIMIETGGSQGQGGQTEASEKTKSR